MTTPPIEDSIEDKLNTLFNKPAGDKAFYLRSELEPGLLALIESEKAKAVEEYRSMKTDGCTCPQPLPEPKSHLYSPHFSDCPVYKSQFNLAGLQTKEPKEDI